MSHPPSAGSSEDWDAMAGWYDQLVKKLEPELRRTSEDLLDAVAAGPGVRLLDLACGPGHTTAAAHARGAHVLGIDTAQAMIDIARRRFPGVPFAVGDMLNPPAGPWNAIVCRFGAHHVDEAWMEAAWHALAPGGRIAFAEWGPNESSPGSRSPTEWTDALQDAEFVDVTTTTRTLHVEPLLADHAELVHEGPAQDGPVYVVSGRRAPQEQRDGKRGLAADESGADASDGRRSAPFGDRGE